MSETTAAGPANAIEVRECPVCKCRTFSYCRRSKAWICLAVDCHYSNELATPPDALTADERGMVERVRMAPLRERPDGKGNYVLVQFSQSDRDALLGLVSRLEKRLAEAKAKIGELSLRLAVWETKGLREKEAAGEFVGQDVMDFRMR